MSTHMKWLNISPTYLGFYFTGSRKDDAGQTPGYISDLLILYKLRLQPQNLRQEAIYKFSLTMKIDHVWIHQGNHMAAGDKVASALDSLN